jgi:hypothetical protein
LHTVVIFGRIKSGRGGEIIIDTALETLRAVSPEMANRVKLMMPDEKARRVGQCVAAASLPKI